MIATRLKYPLALLCLIVFFIAGCSVSEKCLVSSPCKYCGAECELDGLHAGECKFTHASSCPLAPKPVVAATTTSTTTTTTTTTGTGDYEAARLKAMSVIKRSPRCSGINIPSGMKPTIRVTSYKIDGPISFSSSKGSGKISEGEYIIMTQNASGEVGDSAASHGYKDSRWNKYWGKGLKRFCIIWVTDGRKRLLEWGEVVDVN